MSIGNPEPTFENCDHCGTQFEEAVRYPVTAHEDADGTIELYSFCDDTCQAAWEADH